MLAAVLMLGAAYPADATTLERVKARGKVVCGVTQGVPGFSYPDAGGQWSGFDVDLCRAVASAILDDPNAVEIVPTSGENRFTVLQSGAIDLLTRQTTWTLSRESLGIIFAGINYFDGQGFMTRKDRKLRSARELGGTTICTTKGTTAETNLADFAHQNGLKIDVVGYATLPEAVAAYDTAKCDVLSTDQAALAALRTKLRQPEANVILPELISQEPVGPVVRQGDDQWLNIVKWTLFATIDAEALGVTQANVDQQTASPRPDIRRLLGVEGRPGEGLGLPANWVFRIIRHLGNYGESFDRNIGENSPLKLKRGLNALWTKGGILYAPPVR